jgi:serine/threonine-protein kinase
MNIRKYSMLAAATALMLCAVWLVHTFLPMAENAFYDSSFLFRKAPPPRQIAIVGIDPQSIGVDGAWPWQRGKIARLVDKIGAAGPRVIALDFLFPTRTGDPLGDDSLAGAMSRVGCLVLPFRAGGIFSGMVDGQPEIPREVMACRFREVLFPKELDKASFYYTKKTESADSRFLSAAQYGGFCNVSTQKGSQNLREVIHVIRSGAEYFPSFGLAAAAAYENTRHAEIVLDGRSPSIGLKNRIIPISSYAGSSFLHFRGSAGTIPTVSASTILSGSADISIFKDKLVFVGITDPAAANDFFMTPAGPQFPGVEIWATAAADVINGTWIRRLSGWYGLIYLLVMLAIFPGLAIIIPDKKRRLSAGIGTGVMALSLVMWAGLSNAANLFWNPGYHVYAWLFSLLWLALQKVDPTLVEIDISNLEPAGASEADSVNPPGPAEFCVSLPATPTAGHVAQKIKTGKVMQPSLSDPDAPVSTMVEANLSAAIADEGRVIEEFRKLAQGTVIRCLGSGGMADVYLVWKPRLEVYRAVKVLKPDSTGQIVDRFETEIRIFANLSHQNIVQCYEAGEWYGLPYIEMEYIPGSAMDAVLVKCRALTAAQTAAIGILVCRALDYAHKKTVVVYGKSYKGVIHRDLKPANIMLSRGGKIKLTDFGIARPNAVSLHTGDSSKVIGTLPYLAPEQLEGNEITARADIYALGITLYEFLTGERAYPQTDITTLVGAKTSGRIRSLKGSPLVPPVMVEIIDRATAKDPAHRYESCLEMGRALEKCLKSLVAGSSSDHPLAELVKRFLSGGK